MGSRCTWYASTFAPTDLWSNWKAVAACYFLHSTSDFWRKVVLLEKNVSQPDGGCFRYLQICIVQLLYRNVCLGYSSSYILSPGFFSFLRVSWNAHYSDQPFWHVGYPKVRSFQPHQLCLCCRAISELLLFGLCFYNVHHHVDLMQHVLHWHSFWALNNFQMSECHLNQVLLSVLDAR